MSVRARVLGVVVAFGLSATPRVARAWTFVEHRSIGEIAYRRACARLVSDTLEESARRRAQTVACHNLPQMARAYGQATALAGDRIPTVEDFLSVHAGDTAVDRNKYRRMALTNGSHFHPDAPRRWRLEHVRAVEIALEGSRVSGLGQIAAFEKAWVMHAFADHFLHDAFSSGHMGFNRAGTSAAASLLYHDAHNRAGHRVSNQSGEAWTAYGDGYFDAPSHAEGRRRALDAATASVYAFLRAFVAGERDEAHEISAWRGLPYLLHSQPTSLSAVTGGFVRRPTRPRARRSPAAPLAALHRPAHVLAAAEGRAVVTGPWDSRGGHRFGAIGELTVFAPRRGRLGIRVGLGGSDAPALPGAMWIDTGVVARVGQSAHGLFTHLVGVDVLHTLVFEDRERTSQSDLRLDYGLKLEAGHWIVHLQTGPALGLDARRFGYQVSLGLGISLFAAGGGAM